MEHTCAEKPFRSRDSGAFKSIRKNLISINPFQGAAILEERYTKQEWQ
jgi:hypothetical protein